MESPTGALYISGPTGITLKSKMGPINLHSHRDLNIIAQTVCTKNKKKEILLARCMASSDLISYLEFSGLGGGWADNRPTHPPRLKNHTNTFNPAIQNASDIYRVMNSIIIDDT